MTDDSHNCVFLTNRAEGGIGAQLGISARCEFGAMVAFVNKSSNGGLVDSFALSPHLDPTCTDGQPGSNGTHLWLRLPYTTCGQLVAVCARQSQPAACILFSPLNNC